MSIEPEGWHMDAGPPSWDAKAKTFSFFLLKPGRERVLCIPVAVWIPASHFFEFTGTKSPKTKWKFTKAGEDWFCFAGLWRPMPAGGEAFTLLTTEPSPDVAPIHDRQTVVLERGRYVVAVNFGEHSAPVRRSGELVLEARPGDASDRENLPPQGGWIETS